jgi:hypothetical protein
MLIKKRIKKDLKCWDSTLNIPVIPDLPRYTELFGKVVMLKKNPPFSVCPWFDPISATSWLDKEVEDAYDYTNETEVK